MLNVYSQFPHDVVTILWEDNDDVVAGLSPISGSSRGYKTMHLCHLDPNSVCVLLGI